MKCLNCNSNQTVKNGQRKGRQCYKCKQCSRQFLEYYHPWRYSDEVKQLCIKMYLNGMGLRGIERVTDIHHTTVMGWMRRTAEDRIQNSEYPMPSGMRGFSKERIFLLHD